MQEPKHANALLSHRGSRNKPQEEEVAQNPHRKRLPLSPSLPRCGFTFFDAPLSKKLAFHFLHFLLLCWCSMSAQQPTDPVMHPNIPNACLIMWQYASSGGSTKLEQRENICAPRSLRGRINATSSSFLSVSYLMCTCRSLSSRYLSLAATLRHGRLTIGHFSHECFPLTHVSPFSKSAR